MKNQLRTMALAGAMLGSTMAFGQQVVPVGNGSYAEYPPAHEGDSAFFQNFALNPEDFYVAPGETRPIPTNDWWTHLITDQYAGNLWAYPMVADPEPYGVRVFYPNAWNATGTDMVLGNAVEIRGANFNPTEAYPLDWTDWSVTARMPDGSAHMDVQLLHGVPFVWVEAQGFVPEISVTGAATFYDGNGNEISFPYSGDRMAIEQDGKYFGVHLPSGASFDKDTSQFVYVDLGAPQAFNQVVLNWEAAHASQYLLQTSNDAVNWSTIYTQTNSPGGVETVNVSGNARYVRMTGVAKALPAYGYSLWELEVRNGGTNLALGQPASSSSDENPALSASFITDGDATTRWSSGSGATGKLAVAFGAGEPVIALSALTSLSDLNTFHPYAFNRPTNTEVSWNYSPEAGQLDATYTVSTTTGGPTLQGFIPHHYRNADASFGFMAQEYVSGRGQLKLAAGNSFTFSYDFNGVLPQTNLPVYEASDANPYSDARMQQLIGEFADQARNEIGDTYWGGKEFVRNVRYLLMAKEAGNASYEKLKNLCEQTLEDWMTYEPGETEKYFAYYPAWKSLNGFNESYYSGLFTDNHFHYGYFVLGAALMAMDDPAFVKQYDDMLTMVTRQFANWNRDDADLPFMRTFDPWIGHSYAGGLSSPSGNNQESSSEAMQSWAGVFYLGNVLENDQMRDAAAFGYLMESRATMEYWMDTYQDAFVQTGYDKPLVGILWQGGRVYGTYFGGNPIYIHGIQWLPISPALNYLTRDWSKARTQAHYEDLLVREYEFQVAAGTDSLGTADGVYTEGDVGRDWGNVLWGFRLLNDAEYVTQIFDDYWVSANQREYDVVHSPYTSGITYYYAHAYQNLGTPVWDHHISIPTSATYQDESGEYSYVVYNPKATAQTANVYQNGALKGSFTVPANTLVTVTDLNQNPVANTLPTPWRQANLGGNGQAGYGGDTFTVQGSGAGLNGTADAGHWVYQNAMGDQELSARVGSLSGGTASLMVRAEQQPNAAFAAVEVSATGQVQLRYRSTPGAGVQSVSGPTVGLPHYLKMARSEDTFTAYASADGSTWTTVGTVNLTLPDNSYLGMFAASGSGSQNTATFSEVSFLSFADITAIPGRVEAEDYFQQSGTATESTEDVGGGQNIGFIDTGDWLDYKLLVNQAGTYDVDIRVASQVGGGQIALSLNGTVLATVAVPQTAGWQTWTTVSTTLALPAGEQVVRLEATTGGFNLNWLDFQLDAGTPVLSTINVTPANATLAQGSTQAYSAQGLDQFGNPIAATYSWSASAGSIDANGLYTANAAGSHTITATAQGVTGTASVTVTSTKPATNLALGQPTLSSSDENGAFASANAVDGDAGTRWSSAYTDTEWIQVDLGATASVTSVLLNWEPAYGSAYAIQASDDGSTWTTVFTENNGDGGIDDIAVAFSARYVRMQGITRALPYGYSLWEFEVYGSLGSGPSLASLAISPASGSVAAGSSLQFSATGTDTQGNPMSVSPSWTVSGGGSISASGLFSATTAGSYTVTASQGGVSATANVTVTSTGGGTNLALNKPVVSSSDENGAFVAANAVDGDAGTRWASTFADGEWIYVDLQGTYALNRVVLVWEAAYSSHYRIEVSADATNWTTVYTDANADGGTDDISLSGTGRYLRMYSVARATPWGNSLFELEVYGSATGAREGGNSALQASALRIYPNPAQHELHVQGAEGAQFRIVDTSGRTYLMSQQQPLPIGHLRGGVYFLIIQDEGAQQVIRFMKE